LQGKRWWTERVNLPAGLQIVIFIPDFVGKTSDARRVLPQDYKIADVVYNIGRVAWLVSDAALLPRAVGKFTSASFLRSLVEPP
jgi:homoserine kinase